MFWCLYREYPIDSRTSSFKTVKKKKQLMLALIKLIQKSAHQKLIEFFMEGVVPVETRSMKPTVRGAPTLGRHLIPQIPVTSDDTLPEIGGVQLYWHFLDIESYKIYYKFHVESG